MDVFEDIFLLLIIIAPGILAAFIQEWLKSSQCSAKRFIARAVVYTAIVNILSCTLLILWGRGSDSLASLFETVQSVISYGIASFVFALVIPSLFVLLQYRLGNAINKNYESDNKLNSL